MVNRNSIIYNLISNKIQKVKRDVPIKKIEDEEVINVKFIGNIRCRYEHIKQEKLDEFLLELDELMIKYQIDYIHLLNDTKNSFKGKIADIIFINES